MPQEIRVLRCYQCLIFQTDIVKKAKKWQCKLCGEKQSVLKEFCRGTGKECRLQAQKLNANAAIKENAKMEAVQDVLENLEENEENEHFEESHEGNSESKWENYVEEDEEDEIEENILSRSGRSNFRGQNHSFSSDEETKPTKNKRQRISNEFESCSPPQFSSIATSGAKSLECSEIRPSSSRKDIIYNNISNTERRKTAVKTTSKWNNYLDDD